MSIGMGDWKKLYMVSVLLLIASGESSSRSKAQRRAWKYTLHDKLPPIPTWAYLRL